MRPQDFSAYLAERDRISVQKRGHHYTPNSLRSKGYRLSLIARLVGAQSVEELANTLGSREGVEKLVAAASEGRQSGSARLLLIEAREFAQHYGSSAFDPEDIPVAARPPAIEVFTEQEVEALLVGARALDLRLWAFLAFLADTGRRVGEALSLEWSWFRLDADPPHVGLPTTKNGRQQYVPLGTRLVNEVFTPANIAALKAHRPRRIGRDPQVYPFPWTYDSVIKRFRGLQERLGVSPTRGFHIFRHTRATEMLAKGVPMHAVSALLGHANVATTDRVYNHTTSLAFAKYVE